MNIIFYGQLGLPQLHTQDQNTTANRVEALARHFVQDGHKVTVLGTAPSVSSGKYHGIELKCLPSLNPQKPGGWFYLVLGLVSILRSRPDVVHVHGWHAALLLALVPWFLRDTRVIWTVDHVPLPYQLIRLITHDPLLITTPQRSLQYRLLVEYGIKATYIPDGYEEPPASDIALKHFALKKNRYCVALVSSPSAVRRLQKAYHNSTTRRPLIVLRRATPRVRRTLINSAAVVLLGDDSVSQTVLLEAMHAQRTIIAPTYPLYQELLGTTGQYYAPRDAAGLTEAIRNAVTNAGAQQKWGQAAHTRATHHFTWPRLVDDYNILYAPQVRAVLLDSVHVRPRVQYS